MKKRAKLRIVLLVSLVASTFVGDEASAATATLTHVRTLTTDTYGEFFNVGTTGETFSSSAVGDITGDGQPEIVAGFPDGHVYAWRPDGVRLWKHFTGPGAVHASPALVDLTGDGVNDVLVGNLAGYVVGVNGSGNRFFTVRDTCSPICGIFGTPTAADLDRDGQLEVVATSWDHKIHAWKLNGNYLAGFPVFRYDTLWSSPAVADIDGDGWIEIIFGGDMDCYQGQPYPTGGLVWVVRHNGADQPGWPKSLPGATIWSTPAIADLNGDRSLDIVVGTGIFTTGCFPPTSGRFIHAFDKNGNNLPGWPVSLGGRAMGAPAIGDLTGDGRPDVASAAEDGRIYAHRHDGFPLWSRCIANNNPCPVPLHGSPVVADVDNDGANEVVAGGEQFEWVLDGGTGNIESSVPTISGTTQLSAAPTVATVGGTTWVVQTSSYFQPGAPLPNQGRVWIWTTNQALGGAPWPTFKQNRRRTGLCLDDVKPTASLAPLSATQTTLKATVAWSGTDTGCGIERFDVDASYNGGGWTRWVDGFPPATVSGSSAAGSGSLYGTQGMSVSLRTRAIDRGGNVGDWSPQVSTTFINTATKTWPFSSAYAVSSWGSVSAINSPHYNLAEPGPPWPEWNIARGIALRPGSGGYVVDGWGGFHRFGGAPALQSPGYWNGWDIVRGVALNQDGLGGYKLDAWGGLHPIGNAASIGNGPYWPGWDIARGIVLLPGSTGSNPAGYVLDGFGGVHRFGSAPSITVGGYWHGWDIARGIALNPSGSGGYVLDGWGGVHGFGGAAPGTPGPYWYGWDIAKGIVSVGSNGSPAGYILDGFGGVHRFGSAPPVDVSRYWGRDIGRGIALRV